MAIPIDSCALSAAPVSVCGISGPHSVARLVTSILFDTAGVAALTKLQNGANLQERDPWNSDRAALAANGSYVCQEVLAHPAALF